METTVQNTWKPTVAGILSIVGGSLSIVGSIGVIIGIMFLLPVSTAVGPGPVPEFSRWLIPGVMETILLICAVFLLIVGILPIIGGIYALQRRKWGLVLAGSIALIFGSMPLGIAATIFTAISKNEFE